MATKKPSILWRYNQITGYWEAERSCIVGATCEEWLRVYSIDEPRELFKVAVKRPSGTSARDKEKLWSMPPKKNPAPKRKTAARTQRAAESYVRRPSQITKKAPSKRLKKRRTVNLQSPRGVFPNPAPPKYRVMSFSGKKIIGYTNNYSEAVTMARAGRGRWIAGIDKQGGSYFKVKNNPDSVHFDIDVNSHNAKGAKARTRVNPAARKKQIIVEYELSGQNFAIRNRGMYGWKELATFPDTPEGSENAIQYAQAYHKIAPHLRIQVVTK